MVHLPSLNLGSQYTYCCFWDYVHRACSVDLNQILLIEAFCCSLLLSLIPLYSMMSGACGVHKYAQYDMNPFCRSVTRRGQWFDIVTLIKAAACHTVPQAFGCLLSQLTQLIFPSVNFYLPQSKKIGYVWALADAGHHPTLIRIN